MANYRTDEDLQAAAAELIDTLDIRSGVTIRQMAILRVQIVLADAYHQGVTAGIIQTYAAVQQRLAKTFSPQQNKETNL